MIIIIEFAKWKSQQINERQINYNYYKTTDIRATILGTVIIVFNNRVKQRIKKKKNNESKNRDDFKLGRVSRRTAAILFSCARVCVRTMKKKIEVKKKKHKKKEKERKNEEKRMNKRVNSYER